MLTTTTTRTCLSMSTSIRACIESGNEPHTSPTRAGLCVGSVPLSRPRHGAASTSATEGLGGVRACAQKPASNPRNELHKQVIKPRHTNQMRERNILANHASQATTSAQPYSDVTCPRLNRGRRLSVQAGSWKWCACAMQSSAQDACPAGV